MKNKKIVNIFVSNVDRVLNYIKKLQKFLVSLIHMNERITNRLKILPSGCDRLKMMTEMENLAHQLFH